MRKKEEKIFYYKVIIPVAIGKMNLIKLNKKFRIKMMIILRFIKDFLKTSKECRSNNQHF